MICRYFAVYRQDYARPPLARLARKTTVPFEILRSMNVADVVFEAEIACTPSRVPLRA